MNFGINDLFKKKN